MREEKINAATFIALFVLAAIVAMVFILLFLPEATWQTNR